MSEQASIVIWSVTFVEVSISEAAIELVVVLAAFTSLVVFKNGGKVVKLCAIDSL